MTSARRLYRLYAIVAALGLAGALLGLVVATRALSLEPPGGGALLAACRRLLIPDVGPAAFLVLPLAVLGVVVLVLGARSLWRQRRSQRRFLRGLRVVGRRTVEETSVVIVAGVRPLAFCAGLLRPRIYLSTGALERLSASELRAVLAHERHHARRRDPLRILIARVSADALFFMPVLRQLADRYASLAELGADEAVVRRGDRQALASALLSLGERGSPSVVVGVAPERVEHLLGRPAGWQLPVSVLVGSLVALAALVSVVVTAGAALDSASVNLPLLLAQSCMLAMVALPVLALSGALRLWRPLRRARRA